MNKWEEFGPGPLSQRGKKRGEVVKGRRLATSWSMWQCRRGSEKEGFGKGARVSVIQEVQSGQWAQNPSPQINGYLEETKP